jgi:pimeloyl-ACP methyl ester carboxylesterase
VEEPLYFASDDVRLFGVLHEPEGESAPLGVLFCAPFAEEHKQAYRIFVEFARRLAGAGIPTLRFDYRGTGDSDLPFTAFSPTHAMADIAAAASFLRERAGVERVALVGLRLGASLACQAVRDGLDTDALVLWQPIVDGALFYKLNIRRMLVRQMMMHGRASGATDGGEDATIDLDGFLVMRSACEEIKGIDLSEGDALPAPTLLVQLAHNTDVSSEMRPLADRLGQRDTLLPLVLEPFWNRIGYVDCTGPIDATVAWLTERTSS